MSPRVKFLIVLTLLCLAVICGYAIGRYLLPQPDSTASCPVIMAEIIQSAKGDVYKMDDPNYVEPDSYDLVTYSVSGDAITDPVFDTVPAEWQDEQQDSALQKQAWQLFTILIPAEDREMVAEYIIFSDGGENTLAAVDQMPGDLTHWIVEVDVADLDNQDELLFTLIHEYAHLLTLNASQVDIDEEVYNDPYNLSLLKSKAEACPNYFTDGGCSHPNSYIHAFHQRFWADIDAEWKKVDALQYTDDLNPYYAGLYDFYLAHQDQFVDDYSTTHPTEDIAESFAYFVFSPRPEGASIKSQKILFFYEYPELVELRQSILKGTCAAVR